MKYGIAWLLGVPVSDVASRVQDKASEIATRVQETASDLSPRVSGMARQAADKVGATADYVRHNNVSAMLADVERFVKAQPTQALVGAVVIGFLAGRMLRRD